MTQAIAVYEQITHEHIVFDEETGAEVKRAITVAVPKYLPPARAAVYFRIAAFRNSPELLAWLVSRPVLPWSEGVMLSRRHIIHRIGTATPFACGNTDERGDDHGIRTTLDIAAATYLDDEGRSHQPKPCQTCFASGLIVAREAQP